MTPEELIDSTCDVKLALSTGELHSLQRRSAEKQAASGIIGPAGLGIYVRALFDLFKARVQEVHSTVIRVAESSGTPLDAGRISRQVDAKIRPFLAHLSEEVARIGHAPFSREEPYLDDAYRKLRASFDIEIQIAVSKNSPRGSIGQIIPGAPDLQKPNEKKVSAWVVAVLTAVGVGVIVAYIKGCYPGILR